mgnify:CR=1 FL=1
MYRRIRRNFGLQPWRPTRAWIRLVFLSLVTLLLIALGILAPQTLPAIGLGLACGAVLGYSLEGIQSTMTSGALEMSNVDLAQEFTNMIVTQRGFQVALDHVHAAFNAGNHIVHVDFHAVTRHAARGQIGQKLAVAAAQVQHMGAGGNVVGDFLQVAAQAHAPTSLATLFR